MLDYCVFYAQFPKYDGDNVAGPMIGEHPGETALRLTNIGGGGD